MIYANLLHNLATSKPRIAMSQIEAMCLEKAKQGEMYCWVFNPISFFDTDFLRRQSTIYPRNCFSTHEAKRRVF